MSQEIPYSILGYALHKQIGDGGFGLVYSASETLLNNDKVAIKVISPTPLTQAKNIKERFSKEAASVRKLKHDNIVQYRNSGLTTDASNSPYLVMDYIQGSPLSKCNLSYEQKVSCVVSVLNALQYAHDNNVLHRDIKPPNLMVRDSDQSVVIVDFGLAYVFDDLSTKELTTHYVGSIGYIPPEVQADPSIKNAQHDVFSCGITLYEIIANHRPNIQDYKPLHTIDSQLFGLDEIIKVAIAPAGLRYKTAKDFSDALKSWLSRLNDRKKATSTVAMKGMRERLISRKQTYDQNQNDKQERDEKLKKLWDEHSSIILDAANDAFHEFSNGLSDIVPGYSLCTAPIPTPEYQLLIKHETNRSLIAFGFCEPNLILWKDVPSFNGMTLFTQKLDDYARNAIFQSPWVLYTEHGSTQQLRRLHAAIMLMDPHKPRLVARALDDPKNGHTLRKAGGHPFSLEIDGIKEYLMGGLENALGDFLPY